VQSISSINPATGEVLRRFDVDPEEGIEQKLQLARNAFLSYRELSFQQRGSRLRQAAEILDAQRTDFARMMTREMGKPIRAAVQEVEKCALACRYYSENATVFLSDETVVSGHERRIVRYQPLGPVLAIMPWNFPFWQVFRFAAPALMAGNVGLLKHASNVPDSALAIEDIFRRAGFPEGTFQTLLIGSDRVKRIIEDERVCAVTLTGSVGAGSQVAAMAGRQIKKTVLELGGSDPFIVMPSADLSRATATAVQARTVNNGQSCIAAKRFILHERIAQEFTELFVQRMAALKVGDPMAETTEIGPLATLSVLTDLEAQVNTTVKMGARLLLGGKRLDRPGYFFSPTVLSQIPPASPAYKEELFGPVASLFLVDGIDQALRVANDTPFGLGSCLWTNDPHERDFFINRIEAGLAFVNGMVASDPRLPFGGVKQSGYGRELGHHGIREFVNTKTVVINASDQGTAATE
jgi:succinate-semialdehyde dehydrogenase/glutarate-semialdehyde dehydrogenase